MSPDIQLNIQCESAADARYIVCALGGDLCGHGVGCRAGAETIGAVERFRGAERPHRRPPADPLPGYVDDAGVLHPLL